MTNFAEFQRTLGMNVFVPFTQHKYVPVPMPAVGRGSETFANAKLRCERMLETGTYT
jgi:hypothetical protein